MNNKKKLIALVAAGIITAGAIVGGTMAYFSDSQTANNIITMGKVDGNLDEPNYAGNDATVDILPGAEIVKDPTITLSDTSADSYVRMKVVVGTTGPKLTAEQVSYILKDIDTTNWYQDGEYFYYKTVLTANETATIFEKVFIPTELGNDYADKQITIDVTAELIQAANFTPEKNVDGMITGWNGVTVETYQTTK